MRRPANEALSNTKRRGIRMINYIAAACLSVAFGPYCNADRIVACELRDDTLVCAESRPARLKSTAETHIRVLGRASTVDYTVRYWAAE